MLQDIRKSTQGTTAKIIIGLIVVAFAFWGVESILFGGGGNSVAEVNGEEISPSELQEAVNIEQRRLISAMGDNLDPSMLEDQALTQRAMQSLIARKLQLQSALDMGLHISDAQIGAVVAGMQQFQVDGQFSEQMYRALLSESGYSPASFKRAMQEDMLVSQARTGLAASEFATPAELKLGVAVVEEQRDLRFITLPQANFADTGEIPEAEIEAFYQANQENFRSAETVDLDYIELRAEDFRREVEEAEIEVAYEQEVSTGEYSAQNRVSHILLSQGGDESDSDYSARVDKVQAALDAGEDFAKIAGEYSDDPGSAMAGGDLGYTTGDVFPEAMETAIADLPVNQVSEPVTTDAGTHFILVTERSEGKAPSLDELRPALEERLAMQDADAELLRVVESLKDISFNAENLNMPARELGLEVQQSDPVERDQQEGLFSNPVLNAAAFSDDVLNGGLNSEVIELEAGHWVVLHVTAHRQPELLPLDAVRGQIAGILGEQRAQAAVRAAAEDAVRALRSGVSVEEYANSRGYEWRVELGLTRRNNTLPLDLARDAFRLEAPAEDASLVDFVGASNGDYYVYELTRVIEGTMESLPPADRAGMQRLVSGEFGQLIDTEYRQGLRESADIELM